MRNKKLYILALVLVLILAAIFFYNNRSTSKTRTSYKMGTIVKIKVYSPKAEQIIESTFKLLDRLEQKLSSHIKESEINKINAMAGEKAVKVSDDTYRVVSKALEYAKLSKGRFDPTIGPVVELWGIGTDSQKVPKENELKEKVELVDYQQVKLYPEKKKIMLLKKDMSLDVGGIAKGYAADKVIDLFKGKNVEKAFISLGGNVSVLGTKGDGSAWEVGIQAPQANRGEVMASIKLKNKTVVTSGNYERYFMKDGVRYHHILNPNTGRPAKNGIISSTIIADSSFDADALSTIVYILGVDKGLELINDLDNVQALVATEDNKIYITEGIRDKVDLLKNDKYQIVN
ncbi:FAD:protein FMN transferase [Halanaerobacter jeridensis]|uniref:FAD:protein FMN transferase n=1 Tax=Halanaerobacter jeridensis TaxID=706427 RepID=A0A939BM96_9FIRM|nr:FAD:protein FMN transferase [Halanaerobacter jeridensis]MBM7555890.1 thiamine biosynthesis lipoprotein [Halanaerobacter jeridensis]